MIYIHDEGSVYDAPIDVVWDYLMHAGEDHVKAHASSAHFFEVKELSKTSAIVTAERKINGRWSRFVTRSTDYPSLGIVNEELEGDFAGSKFMVIYTPDGNKTRVEAYGELKSDTIPQSEIEQVFLKLLESSFNEDVPALKAFAENAP
jgi:hypothetical protein